ncbi:hypothetical protein BC829DRAFT_444247 [Chytridium lagenaria]|nr:hypothetical protein BC829DRAFT_444247 [Chytridium lagenaria]
MSFLVTPLQSGPTSPDMPAAAVQAGIHSNASAAGNRHPSSASKDNARMLINNADFNHRAVLSFETARSHINGSNPSPFDTQKHRPMPSALVPVRPSSIESPLPSPPLHHIPTPGFFMHSNQHGGFLHQLQAPLTAPQDAETHQIPHQLSVPSSTTYPGTHLPTPVDQESQKFELPNVDHRDDPRFQQYAAFFANPLPQETSGKPIPPPPLHPLPPLSPFDHSHNPHFDFMSSMAAYWSHLHFAMLQSYGIPPTSIPLPSYPFTKPTYTHPETSCCKNCGSKMPVTDSNPSFHRKSGATPATDLQSSPEANSSEDDDFMSFLESSVGGNAGVDGWTLPMPHLSDLLEEKAKVDMTPCPESEMNEVGLLSNEDCGMTERKSSGAAEGLKESVEPAKHSLEEILNSTSTTDMDTKLIWGNVAEKASVPMHEVTPQTFPVLNALALNDVKVLETKAAPAKQSHESVKKPTKKRGLSVSSVTEDEEAPIKPSNKRRLSTNSIPDQVNDESAIKSLKKQRNLKDIPSKKYPKETVSISSVMAPPTSPVIFAPIFALTDVVVHLDEQMQREGMPRLVVNSRRALMRISGLRNWKYSLPGRWARSEGWVGQDTKMDEAYDSEDWSF